MNPHLYFLTSLFQKRSPLPADTPPPSKRVAIVVPAPAGGRKELTRDEEISLRHLERFLGKYDRYMIVPEGGGPSLPGFREMEVDDKYFGSVQAHSWLLMTPAFYDAFLDYEYILIYHLDALVFSDELIEWCDRGFDFVGAPLLVDNDPAKGFEMVGNGGFSLRNVRSFARAARSRRASVDPDDHWREHYGGLPLQQRILGLPVRFLKKLPAFNSYLWETAHYADCEDCFWARRGTHFDPELSIAPIPVALRFSFDREPRYCFEQAGR